MTTEVLAMIVTAKREGLEIILDFRLLVILPVLGCASTTPQGTLLPTTSRDRKIDGCRLEFENSTQYFV